MLIKTHGCTIQGISGIIISVECSVSAKGNQQVLVGLPANEVKEGMHRIAQAIKNSHCYFPDTKLVMSLSPGDIKKSSAAFDLPMAMAVLAASGQLLNTDELKDYLLLGELSLTGEIGKIKGALPAAVEAYHKGFKGIIVPEENAKEAGMVTKLSVYGVKYLTDVIEFFRGNKIIEPTIVDTRKEFFDSQLSFDCDFSEVKGQEHAKRAFEIVAAGSHNAILLGPPGAGKTMLVRRLKTILPPLTLEEALEVTQIYSVSDKTSNNFSSLINQRPLRSPHHSISQAGLVGGGSYPKPGEISLACHGVLFLDELTEFNRTTLEVLRQPMEERKVTISRTAFSVEFPANFMLIASMNLCPCGYYGHPERSCNCSANAVQKYLNKISGPLMDRIDLHVDVKPVPVHLLNHPETGDSSAVIRERVIKARKRQSERFKNSTGIYNNANMTSKHIKEFCKITKEGENLLYNAMEKLHLSARAYDRILKTARTCADLEGSENIELNHLAESINYRTLDQEKLIQDAANKNGKSKGNSLKAIA